MKIENLQKIVKNLGYELKIEDPIFYIDDFFVYQTENPVLIRGLTERPHPTNRTWMMGGTSYDYGDRDTPASSDGYDIREYDYLDIAIKAIIMLLKEREINNMFQSFGEQEWAEEEQKNKTISFMILYVLSGLYS